MPLVKLNAQQIAQRNLSTGTYSASGELLDFMVFDSEALDAGISEYRYFANPLGAPFQDGTSGAKKESDTNMLTAGMVPNAHRLHIHAIGIYYRSIREETDATMLNIQSFLVNTSFDFRIDGKDTMYKSTLQMLMGLNMPLVHSPTTTLENVQANNRNNLAKWFPINVPIVLAELTSFGVTLRADVASAAAIDADKVCVALSGYLERLS